MQVQKEHSHGENTDEQNNELIRSLQKRVDELTAANLLLEERLAQKEQFNAMIAHDLRSPLSPIISYAQVIARQQGAPVARATSIIISQARRMTRLIDDLRDASHLSSGQFTLVRERCDLGALVKELVEQLKPVAPRHTFEVNMPETPIIGNYDAGRMQQAVGNLLDNAIKYSDEHTLVTVSIWQTPGLAHVSVHNKGAGIPSANIALLFRPFTRLPTSSGHRGSGLGLYITKSIIDAHGGTLYLESHADDPTGKRSQGATFSFDLPLPVSVENS
jgi:signal transduction histidine kinase